MPYWRAFYHLIWATKERHHWINDTIEESVYLVIADKSHEKDSHAFIINGMPDHVHVIMSIPPKVTIAEVVSHIKGASSYFVKSQYDLPFAWQRGYGVFTISPRSLDRAITYVRNQKTHHANQTTIPALERVSNQDDGPTWQR